jgi:outer membrane protein assembly factor BamB
MVGVLSIVVAVTTVGAVLRGGDRPLVPTVRIDPSTVAALSLQWTAAAGPGPAYPAVSNDTVYVSTGSSLTAFPTVCSRTNGACAPLWTDLVTDGPLSAPVVQLSSVYTTSSAGRLYAFPARCRTLACPPLWIGSAGHRPLSVPGVNSDYAYVASSRLYAFPAQCGAGAETCPPAWTAELPGPAATGPPASGGGLVLVATGGADGGVIAFPAACSQHCQPVWTGATGGPATGVTIAGRTAFAVARGRLFAFPLTCRGQCEPAWTGPFIRGGPLIEPGAAGRPIVGAGRVYVGDLDGRLWIFPLACRSVSCDALGRVAIGGAPLTTPIFADDLVFAISSAGLVTAIQDGCRIGTEACAPRWSDVLSTSAGSSPAASQTGLYVADDLGTLYAYGLHPAI